MKWEKHGDNAGWEAHDDHGSYVIHKNSDGTYSRYSTIYGTDKVNVEKKFDSLPEAKAGKKKEAKTAKPKDNNTVTAVDKSTEKK